MKMIPLIKVKNIKEAIAFYTGILDFELKHPADSLNEFGVDLINGDAELQLTSMEGIFGTIVNIRVDEIDELFSKYLKRGLDTSAKKESPVHQSPLNQTWGMREFYVTDADGNTLRFSMPIE